MKKYGVRIEGKNFLIQSDNEIKKQGFFTTRFVTANDPQEAELGAVSLLKQDAKLKGYTLNEKDDPPMLYLDEVWEIDFSEDTEVIQGYVFYSEDSDDSQSDDNK